MGFDIGFQPQSHIAQTAHNFSRQRIAPISTRQCYRGMGACALKRQSVGQCRHLHVVVPSIGLSLTWLAGDASPPLTQARPKQRWPWRKQEQRACKGALFFRHMSGFV
jgi:hypothetical protein